MRIQVKYGEVDANLEMDPAELLAIAEKFFSAMGESQQRTMETYRKTIQEAMMAQTTNKLLRSAGNGNPEA